MRLAHRYDENGFYLEDVLIKGEELPKNCTFEPMPQPIYKPFFFRGKWIDAISQEELAEIKNPKTSLTTERRLAEVETIINTLLLGGL